MLDVVWFIGMQSVVTLSVIMLNVAAPWAVIQKGFMSFIPWSDDDAADEGADAAGQVDDATSGKVVEPAFVQPSWVQC